MKNRPFSPGFRLSVLDATIVSAGAGTVWFAPKEIAIVVGMAVGHFFLFCNVFRISRTPELQEMLRLTLDPEIESILTRQNSTPP